MTNIEREKRFISEVPGKVCLDLYARRGYTILSDGIIHSIKTICDMALSMGEAISCGH